MASGGARPGAGRKRGALTKKTRQVAEEIGATGDTPLQTLNELRLWAMGEFRRAIDISLTSEDDGKAVLARADAKQAAEFAADIANKQAPFIHPKLSSIEAKIDAEVQHHISAVEFLIVDPATSSGR